MNLGGCDIKTNNDPFEYLENLSENNNVDSKVAVVSYQNDDTNELSWDEEYSRRKAKFMENAKNLLDKSKQSKENKEKSFNEDSNSPTNALIELEENLIQLDVRKVMVDSVNSIDKNQNEDSYFSIENKDPSQSVQEKVNILDTLTTNCNNNVEMKNSFKLDQINNDITKTKPQLLKSHLLEEPKLIRYGKMPFLLARHMKNQRGISRNNNLSQKSNVSFRKNENFTYIKPSMKPTNVNQNNGVEDMSLFQSISSSCVYDETLNMDNSYEDEDEDEGNHIDNCISSESDNGVIGNSVDLGNSLSNYADASINSDFSVNCVMNRLQNRMGHGVNRNSCFNDKSVNVNLTSLVTNDNVDAACQILPQLSPSKSEDSKENRHQGQLPNSKLTKFISNKYNWAEGLKIDELEYQMDKMRKELKQKTDTISHLQLQMDQLKKSDSGKSVEVQSNSNKYSCIANNTNANNDLTKTDSLYFMDRKLNDNGSSIRDYNPNSSDVLKNRIKDLEAQIQDLQEANEVASKFISSFKEQKVQEHNNVNSNQLISELLMKNKVLKEKLEKMRLSKLDNSGEIPSSKFLRQELENLKEDLLNLREQNQFIVMENLKLKQEIKYRNHGKPFEVVYPSSDSLYRQAKATSVSHYPSHSTNSISGTTSCAVPSNYPTVIPIQSASTANSSTASQPVPPPVVSARAHSLQNELLQYDIKPGTNVPIMRQFHPDNHYQQNQYNRNLPQNHQSHPQMYSDQSEMHLSQAHLLPSNNQSSGLLPPPLPHLVQHQDNQQQPLHRNLHRRSNTTTGTAYTYNNNHDNTEVNIAVDNSNNDNRYDGDVDFDDDEEEVVDNSCNSNRSHSNCSQSTDDILRQVHNDSIDAALSGAIGNSTATDSMKANNPQYSQTEELSRYHRAAHTEHLHSYPPINNTNLNSTTVASATIGSTTLNAFSTLHRTAIAPTSGNDVAVGDVIKFIRQGGRISKGLVHFIGKLPRRNDIYIGVELELEDGKHDGVYEGNRYFKCKQNKGVFVAFNKVIMVYSRRSN